MEIQDINERFICLFIMSKPEAMVVRKNSLKQYEEETHLHLGKNCDCITRK